MNRNYLADALGKFNPSTRDTALGLFSAGVFSVMAVNTILLETDDAGLLERALQQAWENIIYGLLHGIFGVVGILFSAPVEYILTGFPTPGSLGGLAELWVSLIPLYWGILTIGGMVYFGGSMLFPEAEEADPFRFGERVLVSTFVLIATSPMLPSADWLPGDSADGFSIAVYLVNNVIADHILAQSDFNINFVENSFGQLLAAQLGTGVVIGVGAIAVLYTGGAFLVGILITVGLFYVLLSMRMILVYTVYGLMPLLLAMWVVDIGPFKYAKTTAEMVFKLTAILLLLGIVIAGIMAATGAIAGGSHGETVSFADDLDEGEPPEEPIRNPDGTLNEDAFDQEPEPNQQNSLATHDAIGSYITMLMLRIFSYMGGMVLVVALTTSALGMAISMRGASGIKRRMRQGRNADPQGGGNMSVFGGGGGGNQDIPSELQGSVESDGDSTFMVTDDGTGVVFDSEDGSISTFDAQEPDQGTPLTEKLDYATGGKVSDMKEGYENSKERVEEWSESGAVEGPSQEDGTGPGFTPVDDPRKTGQDVAKKTSDMVRGVASKFTSPEKAFSYGKNAGAAAGFGSYKAGKAVNKAATGIKNSTAAQSAAKAGLQAGNYMKRGGKAYGSIYAQPDARSSIGETARIMRESDILDPRGKVSESGSASDPTLDEKGMVDSQARGDVEASDLDTFQMEEVFDNPEDFEGNGLNMENLTYEELDYEPADSPEGWDAEPEGKFVDQNGNEMIHVGGEDSPDFEAGETYDLGNVSTSGIGQPDDDISGHINTDKNTIAHKRSGPDDKGDFTKNTSSRKNNTGNGYVGTTTVEDFADNTGDHVDQRFDIENARFVETDDMEDHDTIKQKGKLVGQDGSEAEYISFENGDAPTLEDGEQYNLSSATTREYDTKKSQSHRSTNTDADGKYQQIHADSSTSAEKVGKEKNKGS